MLMVFVSSFAKQNRFFHCAVDRSLGLLLSTIFDMDSYKGVWSLLYSTKLLHPTAVFLCCMKMDLVQYSSGKGKHLLKLRCSSLREKQVEGASDVVRFFLSSYFRRPLSLVPYIRLSFVGTPAMSILWVASIQQLPDDHCSDFRLCLLHEKWNSVFDSSWQIHRSSRADYLDFVLRVMGKSAIPKGVRRSVPCCNEYDDLVFMKFSDRESRVNRPLVFGLAISILFLLLFFCFCIYRFVTHLRVFYSPVCSKHLKTTHESLTESLGSTACPQWLRSTATPRWIAASPSSTCPSPPRLSAAASRAAEPRSWCRKPSRLVHITLPLANSRDREST